MTRLFLSLAVATAALALAAPAQAVGLTRTFVSAAGNDSNACTVTAPCRTLAGAYGKTAPSGIIAAIDPAGYGPLTITGPVTIDGNGFASITAPTGGAGITVNAGASDTVILRGLAIDGANVFNTNGIAFNTGGALTVDHCVVRNMNGSGQVGAGVFMETSATTPQTLTVSNSYFIDNGNGGIEIQTQGSGGVTASIDRTVLAGNFEGVAVHAIVGAVTVAVSDTAAINNSNAGFIAVDLGAAVNLAVTRSQSVGNRAGIVTGATVWLAQSTVAQNLFGYDVDSGAINTFGNNYFINNGGNVGSLTPVGAQ
jgi:hypothetical protein